ncbi:MAG: hypothetical protein COA79_12515 [Planctomycetota bacterium]|nr:MAG: hypothetical protein COA79_12515 [Planctomycetota bacterium]
MSLEPIHTILTKNGFTSIHDNENFNIYSRNGWLWSTYIFSVIKVDDKGLNQSIQKSFEWVKQNVNRRIPIAQIGFNVVLLTTNEYSINYLKPYIDMHANRDPNASNSSLTETLTNTKDIIFQTAISINVNTKKCISVKTWILVGSVRNTYNELSKIFL